MRVLVTGVAGFIGSQLAARLLEEGHDVHGVDAFTSAYPSRLKHHNLDALRNRRRFKFDEADIRDVGLEPLLDPVDVVFHLSAIAGVRASWRRGFRDYVEHNILATQRLLEAARHTSRPRIVYASSSSVYGNADRYPVQEDDPKQPLSPYGVSKLSAEHLCETYAEAFNLQVVTLRYFSVYGPRQRPDMGVHRIIEAALSGATFTVFGDGNQVRDMTYVGDVVNATIRAAEASVPAGTVVNVAGGSQVSLKELITLIGEIAGAAVNVEHTPAQPGDVNRTDGDTTKAREILGWEPKTRLDEGLSEQIEWHREAEPALMS